jgi:hypothetical protein
MTEPLFGYMGRGLDGGEDGGLNGDNAEGLDGKVEEENQRQQRLVTSNTEVGIIAAAHLVNIASPSLPSLPSLKRFRTRCCCCCSWCWASGAETEVETEVTVVAEVVVASEMSELLKRS